MLTVVYDIIKTSSANTTKNLPMFNTARTEYSDSGRVNGDKTTIFLFTVSLNKEKLDKDTNKGRSL